MAIIVDLQIVTKMLDGQREEFPTVSQCESIINQVFIELNITQAKECTVRIVSEVEAIELNHQYRGKQGATNILSFPFENDLDMDLLGDLVLCAKVVIDEAAEQNKQENAHWAHLLVHGTLHLLGYDHQNETEAEQMESIECSILKELNVPNPYA